MYLQGNLQTVFDALYEMGVIEPVLQMDWKDALKEMDSNPTPLFDAVKVANDFQSDVQILIEKLESLDEKTLSFLAMEVAREYADFHGQHEVH
jgi:hypothetical protein